MLWKQKLFSAITTLVMVPAGLAVACRWPATCVAQAVIVVDAQLIPDRYVSSNGQNDFVTGWITLPGKSWAAHGFSS